jgi:hypothetical protein
MAPYAHRYGVRVVCHLGPSLAPTHTLCLCPSKSRATSAWVCSCGVCAPLEYAWCCLPVWSCRSTRVRSSVCQRCVCVCLCVSVCQRCVCVCLCMCSTCLAVFLQTPPFLATTCALSIRANEGRLVIVSFLLFSYPPHDLFLTFSTPYTTRCALSASQGERGQTCDRELSVTFIPSSQPLPNFLHSLQNQVCTLSQPGQTRANL